MNNDNTASQSWKMVKKFFHQLSYDGNVNVKGIILLIKYVEDEHFDRILYASTSHNQLTISRDRLCSVNRNSLRIRQEENNLTFEVFYSDTSTYETMGTLDQNDFSSLFDRCVSCLE